MQCAGLCCELKTCYESGGNRITNIALIGCFDSFLWANNVLNMVVNFLNKVRGARKSHQKAVEKIKVCNGVKERLLRPESALNDATWFVGELSLGSVNAAAPLAKAVELCYVDVGDGSSSSSAQPFLSTMRGFFPLHCSVCRCGEKKEIPIYLKFNQQNCPRVFWDGKYSFCVFNKGEYMQGGGGQLSCLLLI